MQTTASLKISRCHPSSIFLNSALSLFFFVYCVMGFHFPRREKLIHARKKNRELGRVRCFHPSEYLWAKTPHDVETPNFNPTFSFFSFSRSLPKLSAHEDEGVHQNPQYTGQHHFHPVKHDHDYCERVVINVSAKTRNNKNRIQFRAAFSPAISMRGKGIERAR